MTGWQIALALLALAWALQCVGTMIQVRRYRDAFRDLSGSSDDGWMGVGKGGGALRGAAIAMITVSPEGRVCRATSLEGRTVFAKARRLSDLEGRPMTDVRAEAGTRRREPLAAAILSALDQIDQTRARQNPSPEARHGEPLPA
ncbi:transcriptional regulator GutM [Aureimonas phyllosphaerae]|uniref:DNA-binding transcriptional regulator of glucitol operon n=1 Tax=Aureimonas phyllosphaerae TaxID=1166078 RepID=A0A7W6BVA5_9HYPH|nr:transcriptional regulator GutM [Aureimonas phyllosphaerae]MBB3935728.1 DNA-binding transcriptional regulator of glucitol operon [Aureimonas phyllosphaerae]MBB3959736.1 DNA-binding transcriptional regulator of glucitol operon [Aureimonas phyllosphaerae]SFF14378.1 DNA-binding transcriptional regulator of glucitol operon [Aureimonas phyllosphaerae]